MVANNSLTIPSYFEHRFNDKSKILRTATSLVVIIFFAIYSSAGFVSCGILFSTSLGIDYHTALIMSVLLLVIYTASGGFLAVNWVDVFQGGLMLLALIVFPLFIFYLIYYGHSHLLSVDYLLSNYPDQFRYGYFNILPIGNNFVVCISLLSTMAWGLGYFGQPHILVRFMASNSKNSINSARKICMLWMFLVLLGAIAIGFLGKLFYLENPLAEPEQVFFELVNSTVNQWVAGWLIAAVLSCVMSTIAAQLLLTASTLCEDFYHDRINPKANDARLLWMGRATVVFVALIALILAWNKNNSVLALVGHAWAGLGASFGPVILFSLFWRRMTKEAALAGILSGALTVIIWVIARYLWLDIKNSLIISEYNLSNILVLYEIIPGFFISAISIILCTLSSKNNDPKVIQLYNRAHNLCKES